MLEIHPTAAPEGIFAMTAAAGPICSSTPRAVHHAPGLGAFGA